MSIKLKGSTDGSVTLQAPADTSPSGTDKTLTLPTTVGSAEQFLKNSGTAGELEYSSMVETSTGVGIGTTSPQTKLHSSGTTNGAQATFGGSDSGLKISTFQKTDNDAGVTLDAQQSSNGTLTFATAGTERARLDSSGRLLVNTTSNQDNYLVQVKNGDVSLTKSVSAAGGNAVDMLRFRVHNSGNTAEDASLGGISAETVSNWGGSLTFHTKPDNGSPNETVSERMRIDSSGRLLFGKTGTSFHLGGSVLYPSGEVNITRDGAPPLFIRRNSSDGQLVTFYQDGTAEGNISVSGSTVSIQGAHLSRWSQLAGGTARTEILRGTVLSNLDEMCEWAHAAQAAVLYTEEDELPEGVNVGDVKTPAVEAYTEDNEQLNRMKVSDVEGDVNVAGVFQDWDDDDDTHTNDFNCAMTGDFVIRIAQGTTVARGDLLMSAGDGTAKPQDDDIVRSKTIAKVTSTTVSTTYSDGSYCVPCVLMAC